MRSPAEMNIIQIELTDACESKCGACTRLVPHVSKFFYTTPEQFERAVKSMAGWRGGILGVMGGNPVLHPQFEQISRRFAELWGRPTLSGKGRAPIQDFSAYANERLHDGSSGRGLWSSLGAGFYRHLEVIHDVYDYWCINDHVNAGLHQGLLIGRKEFCETNGMSDDEWQRHRDNCWVQRTWSASVNPHGAYFCEVAGAIDNLFYGGKSAWPVEHGWWQRTPADFRDQLHLCDHCALAQPGPSVVGHDDRDIVGRLSLPLLESVGSPAVRKKTVEVYDPASNAEHRHKARDFRVDWYMPEPLARVSSDNPSVRPKKITGVVTCVGRGKHLRQTIAHNAKQVDELYVVIDADSWCEADPPIANVHFLTCQDAHRGDVAFNKGTLINAGLQAVEKSADWILLTDADVFLHADTLAFLKSHSLNPGVLYGTHRVEPGQAHAPCGPNAEPNGYFQLFHRNASAIRGRWPAVMSEEFCSAGGIDSWFMQQFPHDKRYVIPEIPVTHIPHAKSPGADWNGSYAGWRQCGMITPRGMLVTEEVPPTCMRFRLTDTLRGETVECGLDGEMFPAAVLTSTGTDLIFNGQSTQGCHVAVAYWRDPV